jgi:hypothetical protein
LEKWMVIFVDKIGLTNNFLLSSIHNRVEDF